MNERPCSLPWLVRMPALSGYLLQRYTTLFGRRRFTPADFALALIAFVGLARFRASPLLVVAFAAIVGGLLGLLQ